MERGRQVCRILKDIRKQIAEENDIEFITSECTHKGDCAGTCPRCEAEVRYLESQLARRRMTGRAVRLTGVSMGLAAVAPAILSSCDPVIDGDIIIPTQGDVPAPEFIALGENLVFDLISYDTFMDMFSKGGWVESEVYDVFPGGRTGDEILGNIDGYTPRKYAVRSETDIKQYFSFNADPHRFEYKIHQFSYDQNSNTLVIDIYGSRTRLFVASIDEEKMVCYGDVFSTVWAPDAFLGKYVFRHVSDETVARWDEKYSTEQSAE
ncbi:MAG: hypothetical protein IKY16_03845 [Bacteroidales bacterium]|nr:hypothetical protein [Bacteroidales bacterium]